MQLCGWLRVYIGEEALTIFRLKVGKKQEVHQVFETYDLEPCLRDEDLVKAVVLPDESLAN